jgi:heptosyltransferase-1
MRRVLLVKTSSMGDVIHTLPALTDASRVLGDVRFDWVVEEGFAEIPRWHPAVETVIPVAIRRWRKTPLKSLRSDEWKQFRAQLARHGYDAIVDAQGLLKSAWLTLLAHGPRYGLDGASARESLASWFYQQRLPVAKGMHAVERVRQLLGQALGYTVPSTIGDYGLQQARFDTAQVPAGHYAVCLHGTTWPEKHYPETYWRDVIEGLRARALGVALPWGSAHERERAERLAQGMAGVQVLPRCTLNQMAALLQQARVVVAVDTGLGHLTAALDTPCVSLYGPTSPRLVGAYGRHQRHLVAADYAGSTAAAVEPALFAALTPAIVLGAVDELLREQT